MTLTGNGANFGDMTCTGLVQVNALKYTNPSGVTNYINPMTFLSSGGISGYQGSSSNYGSSYGRGAAAVAAANPGYSLPGIFRANGALEDQGARSVIVGEAGPELILPAKFTRMFTAMADSYSGSSGSSSGQQTIVIENNHYWDGRKVTDLVMTQSKKRLQQQGAASVR
jgi:hypothetical protein